MRYDYLIVGAGLFGCTFANIATELLGKKCLLIEKRDEIGGNCATEYRNGIQFHKYGPHIFHTNNKFIWDYVNRFAKFNNFKNVVKSLRNGILYSFPINLTTLNQLFGVITPAEAKRKMAEERVLIEHPNTFEEACLERFGEKIYLAFFRDYTKKQWGMNPTELPAEIAYRIPIRFTCEDVYNTDKYYGIPVGGYTKLMKNMLSGVRCELGVDFLKNRQYWERKADVVVFSGKIDEYFDYKIGKLPYRSIKFEEEWYDEEYHQGVKIITYPSEYPKYTRSIEHKFFEDTVSDSTIITREYPCACADDMIPMYPIETYENKTKFDAYQGMLKLNVRKNVIVGGRLGEYRYYDMDRVILSAFNRVLCNV